MNTNADCSANVVLQEDVAKWTECQLCCNVLSEDTKGRFLTINEQLPSSCLSSVRLLRLLGISCPVPDSHFLDVATIHACTKCYSLLMEADSVYQSLFSLASKMKKVWGKHTMDDGIFGLRITDSESVDVSTGGQPEGDPGGVSAKAGTSGSKQNLCQTSSSNVSKSYIPILPKLNLVYIPFLPQASIVPGNVVHTGVEKVMIPRAETRQVRKEAKSNVGNEKTRTRRDENRRVRREVKSRSGSEETRAQRDEIREVTKEVQNYVCRLCDSGFNSERSWLLHFRSVHRIQEKWFDYSSQLALKKSLRKGLQKMRINTKEGNEGNASSDNADCVHKCSACDEENFQTRVLFVEHLHKYHNLDIEEDVEEEEEDDEEGEEEEDSCSDSGDSSSGTDVASQEVNISSATVSKVDVGSPLGEEEEEEDDGNDEDMEVGDSAPVCMDIDDDDPVAEAGEAGDGCENSEDKSNTDKAQHNPEICCLYCSKVFESHLELQEHNETHFSMMKDNTNEEGTEHQIPVVPSSSQETQNDHDIQETTVITTAAVTATNKLIARRRRGRAVCNLCGERFLNNLLLLKHKENAHNVVSNIGKLAMLECKYCGLKLRYISSLKQHIAKAHNQELDSQEFSAKSYTKIQHEEETSAEASSNVDDPNGSSGKVSLRHQCSMCHYQSETRQDVERHARKEHDTSSVSQAECKYCGKFYTAKYLESHINNMHENKMNYACNDCPMKFRSLVAVYRHRSEEHSKKTWKCDLCQEEFSKYHRLRQHNLYVHSSKVHLCSVCGKTFKRKSDLTLHGKRRHMEKVRSNCTHCSKSYCTRVKLRLHMLKDHGVAWEDSYSENYARVQRDNNCLRYKPRKSSKVQQSAATFPEPEKESGYSEIQQNPDQQLMEEFVPTQHDVQNQQQMPQAGNEILPFHWL